MSRDDVAAGIDAHPITVSKLISGKMKLTQDWMARFSTVFGVPPEQIITAPSATRIVKVRSHVEAGAWESHSEWPEEEWYSVAIPDDPRYRTLELFGSETRGPSMNRRYPEQTVLVHTSFIAAGERLEVGKRYIVERERPDGTRETTVKTLSRDEDGRLWLMPESTDPRFQAPIPIDDDVEAVVRVVGRVIYSVQRED
ncbi:phage repressor [Devosia sp. Root635]|nr:phage repressor [Devosia sp. Root635]